MIHGLLSSPGRTLYGQAGTCKDAELAKNGTSQVGKCMVGHQPINFITQTDTLDSAVKMNHPAKAHVCASTSRTASRSAPNSNMHEKPPYIRQGMWSGWKTRDASCYPRHLHVATNYQPSYSHARSFDPSSPNSSELCGKIRIVISGSLDTTRQESDRTQGEAVQLLG